MANNQPPTLEEHLAELDAKMRDEVGIPPSAVPAIRALVSLFWNGSAAADNWWGGLSYKKDSISLTYQWGRPPGTRGRKKRIKR